MALNKSQYLFWCLTEECSEVIKACSKTERFGPDNHNPADIACKPNIEELLDEMYDLRARARMLFQFLGVPYGDSEIDNYLYRKEKLERNMEKSRKLGLLKDKSSRKNKK